MAEEIKNEEMESVTPDATQSITDLQKEIESLKAELAQMEKLKKSVSEACADAAEWKRKYRATLDESERAKQEQAEKQASMESELNSYRAKERINSYFAKLVNAGYSPEVAQEMANGLPDGVPDSFFDNQKSFLESKAQEIKAQVLNAQPGLTAGMPPATQNKESDDKVRHWMGLD